MTNAALMVQTINILSEESMTPRQLLEAYRRVCAICYNLTRGQDHLRQQTIRIRKACGEVPEDMDTEEAVKRLVKERAELLKAVAEIKLVLDVLAKKASL